MSHVGLEGGAEVVYLSKLKDKPFNSKKWSSWNFSPEYPYIIQETGNVNIQTYHLEVVILILYQILITDLQGNV